jgi:hypothetical protein
MVFLPYWSFAKACGPNFAFLESLMKARDDLDKSDVSGIMESAKRKVKNEGLPDVPMVEGSVGEPMHGAGIMKRVETSLVAGGAAALLWGRVGGAAAGLTSSQMAPSNSSGGTGWSTIAQNYLGSGWRDRVVQ